MVIEGRLDWLLGLGIAVSWAGLTMTVFAVALPQVVVLPAQMPLTWAVISGGAILGLGATINQGCFLGSVARLGRGELDYLFTLIGIALAMALAPRVLPWLEATGPMPAGARTFRSSSNLFMAAIPFLPLALFGIWRWRQHRRQTMLALIVVGIAGGTVYACNPDWSYSSGLFRVVTSGVRPGTLLAESAALAVVLGVAISAALGNRFELCLARTRTNAARLLGGFLMGTGALLVPGGNDTLMLWAIPGLTLYGLVAYAVMIATIMMLLKLQYVLGSR
jgi:toxin CptA